MSTQSKAVIVDRAVLLSSLVGARSGRKTSDALAELVRSYDTILFEPTGMSALYPLLEARSDFGRHFVEVPVARATELGSVRVSEMTEAVSRWATRVSAGSGTNRAVADDNRVDDRDLLETMEYAVRLVLVGLMHGADVAVSPRRLAILTQIFETVSTGEGSSVTISLQPLASELVRLIPPGSELETTPAKRKLIFISYSHKDQRWLDLMLTHLRPFARADDLRIWSDRQITPSSLWEQELKRALGEAAVAILIVSANYLASEYVAQVELPVLIGAAGRNELRIIWFLATAAAYDKTPLRQIQASHNPLRPLDSVPVGRRNQVLVEVARATEAALGVAESRG